MVFMTSDTLSRFMQPRVDIAFTLPERAPEQLLQWYLCVFRRRYQIFLETLNKFAMLHVRHAFEA